MEDKRILIVKAHYPDELMKVVNGHLDEGGWRVAQTEMSVTDHHYYALLIQSAAQQNQVKEDQNGQ